MSAAILAIGGEVLASRRTAAHLHGLTDRAPRTIELVVPYDRMPTSPAPRVRVWRSRTLLPGDRWDVRRLPATSRERTVCDLAAVMTVPELRALLIDGRQRRLLSLESVLRRQALMAGTSGLPRLRMVAYELDATRCDSVLAWRARQLLDAAGLRPDPSEHPVTAPNGVTVHLDVPFVDYQVAVEAEGMGAHSERRQLESDVRRRNTLRLMPYRVIWVTWQRLDRDPDGFVAEVRGELERRGWPGEPRLESGS